jgi:UDP-perosamine 4-acetyltransferase
MVNDQMTKTTAMTAGETMKSLVIVGSTAPEIVKLLEARGNAVGERIEVAGFLDDDSKRHGSSFMNLPILGGSDMLQERFRDAWVINNVAKTMEVRRKVWGRLAAMGARFYTAVHPSVDRSYAEIGSGSIVQERVILGPYAAIGQQCILGFASIVAHESVLGDCCFLAPGVVINGRVTVKEGAFLGAGSIVMANVTVGEGSVVEAGSVVATNVPPNTTVSGSPARVIAERAPEGKIA